MPANRGSCLIQAMTSGHGTISAEQVNREVLAGFLSKFGRRFYRLPDPEVETGSGKAGSIVIERKGEKIPASIKNEDGSLEVGISRAGDEVFSLRWK